MCAQYGNCIIRIDNRSIYRNPEPVVTLYRREVNAICIFIVAANFKFKNKNSNAWNVLFGSSTSIPFCVPHSHRLVDGELPTTDNIDTGKIVLFLSIKLIDLNRSSFVQKFN